MVDIELLKRLAEACDIERCADEEERDRNLNEFYSVLEPEDVAALIAENEAMQERLKLLTIPKEEGPPEIPPHLHGLADAIFTMTENGEDPSDMLAMLDAGMKKAYKATAQIGPKWDDDKTQIVNAMCMTWRHDFGLLKKPGQHRLSSGMTEDERDALRQQMGQLYEHHVAPLLYEARRQILRAADQEQAARYWKKRFDEDTTEAIDQLKAELERARADVNFFNQQCRHEKLTSMQLQAENERLRKHLAECADSLESEILDRYGLSKDHPAMRRKFELDMLDVIEARAALGKGGRADG